MSYAISIDSRDGEETAASNHGLSDLASTLFSHVGVDFPLLRGGPGPSQVQCYMAATGRSFLLLSANRRKDYNPTATYALQLSLPLMVSSNATVLRIAPRRRYAYLDYGVYDVFRDLPLAAGPALRLEAKGVSILGQLVQLSENEVRTLASVDEETIDAIKRRLALVGFGFDMRVPDWNREYRKFCARMNYLQGPSFS